MASTIVKGPVWSAFDAGGMVLDPPYASGNRRTPSGDGTLRLYAEDGVTVLREEQIHETAQTMAATGLCSYPDARDAIAQMTVPPLQPFDVQEALQAASTPANPQPAASQVWAPPEGEPRPGWVDVDGTVTFAENHETPRDGRLCLTRGGTMDARDLDGWRCIGVATERGRVMVGDFFVLGTFTFVALRVLNSGAVAFRCADGSETSADPERALSEWQCIRYAPARAGERYRSRRAGTLTVLSASAPPVHRGDHDLREGAQLDPALWERLDPSTASHAVAPVPREPESDAALRGRIVWAHRSGYTHSALLFGRVVAEIAATLPVMFMDVETYLGRVLGSPAHEWADLAARRPTMSDCNPLTATGAALDRLAPLWGIERRGGTVAGHGGLAETIALANGIRDALQPTPGIGTIPDAPRECRPGLYNIADASLAFTRIHDAQPKPAPVDPARAHRDEVRRAVDRLITADKGQPFAHARAAALHAWAETLYGRDTVADVAAVHAGLVRYEALRGSRREPSLAAMDVGVPETARAMYERERAGKRVESVTPPEEPARPTGGASLNGWQTSAHFWERWSR